MIQVIYYITGYRYVGKYFCDRLVFVPSTVSTENVFSPFVSHIFLVNFTCHFVVQD